MVRIVKENKTRIIPKSAYGEYYKNSGWVLDEDEMFGKNNIYSKDDKEENVDEDDWDSLAESDYGEKSLSEMNRQELSEKAESLGIDISDCTTNKMIRERIKKNS